MADAKQELNNGTSQSRSVLAKPRLGAFGSSGFGTSTFGSILRPSQLKPNSNPFLKVTETEEAEKKEKANSEAEKSKGEDRLTETKEDAPKFVPLGATSSAPRSSTQVPAPAQPTSGTSGFVFGQNLSERVVIQESVNNGDAGPSEHSMKNGTSDLLFTSAAASVKDNSQESAGASSTLSAGAGAGAGLAAAAAEYERAQARPPPPAVTTTTGEEDEINVLQVSCRLFAWEAGSWRERGRGVLRLNDADGGSRLVARVAGSLRVVLNTKIWPDMVAERAGSKSLRITATDAAHQVKLFLIMGNPGDIVQLHRAVLARISLSKRAAPARRDDSRETGEPDHTADTLPRTHSHRLEAPPHDDDDRDAHSRQGRRDKTRNGRQGCGRYRKQGRQPAQEKRTGRRRDVP
ncbi:ran-binding protein 3 [Leguminivora glycinivorella]|uniref:ran-binding protein 3 n=1 Tax=Leguminivora glycinivorella TaxID=1035111 RepID=UPI00200C6319|nr:ran-binding protein 3 [Leguminivora glycinivorella]